MKTEVSVSPKVTQTLEQLGMDTIPGLTKRELFAALAMHALESHNTGDNGTRCYRTDEVARIAVNQADELLKALSKSDDGPEA